MRETASSSRSAVAASVASQLQPQCGGCLRCRAHCRQQPMHVTSFSLHVVHAVNAQSVRRSRPQGRSSCSDVALSSSEPHFESTLAIAERLAAACLHAACQSRSDERNSQLQPQCGGWLRCCRAHCRQQPMHVTCFSLHVVHAVNAQSVRRSRPLLVLRCRALSSSKQGPRPPTQIRSFSSVPALAAAAGVPVVGAAAL